MLLSEVNRERLLRKKIGNLLILENVSNGVFDDKDYLQKSFFEIQMLARQLYPNNAELVSILDKYYRLGHESNGDEIGKNGVIIKAVHEIASSISMGSSKDDPEITSNFSRPTDSHKGRTDNTRPNVNSDSLSPRDTIEKIEKTEIQKVTSNLGSTFILAVLAGAFIALGGIYFTFATSEVSVTPQFTQILGGVAFSTGLMLVVITGAQLFTSNNLGIIGLASRKITVAKLVKNWIIVYLGNAVGAVLTAAIFYLSNAWTSYGYQYGIRAIAIANHKIGLSFVEAFFLGILCNCLVCLAIWLAASGKKVSDKILAIIFPVSAFVAIGFEHSVANMYFLSFAFMIKDDPSFLNAIKTAGLTVDTLHLNYMGIIHNLLPVTLGNIVGGSIFIGLAGWFAHGRKSGR